MLWILKNGEKVVFEFVWKIRVKLKPVFNTCEPDFNLEIYE